jgi:DNA-binding beta-propeller fold protein YncE
MAEIEPAAVAEEDEEERKRRRRLLILLLLLLAFMTLLGLLTGWYLLFRKPITELVPPLGGDAPPRYLTSVYEVNQPMGVAVGVNGERLYVTEGGGEQLTRMFDRLGREIGVLEPPADGRRHVPVYVAVQPGTGEVWVTDRGAGEIYIYDPEGTYLRTFTPTEEIANWQPLGIAFAPDGDVWVTDLSPPYHRVEVFGLDGTLKRQIGQPETFDFPNMIAFDAAGHAYVTSSNSGRLVILDPATGAEVSGLSRGSAPGALGLPRGVAIDDAGRLYVVDTTGHTVHLYRVATEGDLRPVHIADFGTEGVDDGAFTYPNGVAVDDRARVYVTDRENNRVQVWGY